VLAACALFLFSVSAYGQEAPAKKNARPKGPETADQDKKPREFTPVYFYEFVKPEFVVSRVLIQHDENGTGSITFEKRDGEEPITDPLQLSEKTMESLRSMWDDLDFLNSDTVYQSPERNYAHLGTMRLEMRKDGKDRSVEFNWTDMSEPKALTDEYKKIGNQFIWMFDMNVARQNQPLEAPRIMDGLESYLRRDAIADPAQILPYLKELKDDERIPLIARNHAARIITRLEKKKKKK